LCASCLGEGVFGERDFSDFSTPSATPPAVENRSRNGVKTAEDVDDCSLWNNTFLVSDIFLRPVQQKQQHRHRHHIDNQRRQQQRAQPDRPPHRRARSRHTKKEKNIKLVVSMCVYVSLYDVRLFISFFFCVLTVFRGKKNKVKIPTSVDTIN
jgi:hypothetical protein